ncbi:MAG: hypothetical protein HUJ31_10380 [Pseudomonadales bacterium]|nr:hypothetical protein [Pseudomonadales bacterium]
MSKDRFERIMDDLKTHRDEINVRMHLARAELKDEWEELEDKLDYAQSKLKQLKKEGEQGAGEVHHALEVITDELSEAYRRIRDRLNKAS